jgi:glucuronoarabinoxylan endo-1,4-beta-xylanase
MNNRTISVLNAVAVVGAAMTFPIGLALSDYSDATLNDSTAVNNIAVVGGHFYGNGNYVHQNALNHGKHV